ncbi:MAG: SDH family Clp fold serine proteinase [Promethearchaeota archaeon]
MGLLHKYLNQKITGREIEKKIQELIQTYNEKKNSYLILFCTYVNKPIHPNLLSLSMEDYYIIFDILKDIDSQNIDFYLETPGGSAEATEEIAEFLHDKFDTVSFIVSGEAKSAGTILVLSGNEITMSKSGSLGPIDAQMRIGRSTVSAFDYMEWVENKRNEAEKKKKLNPFDATMIAQISPGELKGVNNALKFAEDLVVEWLAKYKFKNWNFTETHKLKVTDVIKTNRAKEIAKELLDHSKWRSHGRSIKINELEEFGLKINKLEDNIEIYKIIYEIQMLLKIYFLSTTAFKVFFTCDQKLVRQATRVPKQQIIPKGNADVIEVGLDCPKCGKNHKLFVKFTPNPQIDEDYKKKGMKPFPKNNKFLCDCGFEIDLTAIRNQLESNLNKKIK